MTDREIWNHIMADLAYLRERVDDQSHELLEHIKDETSYQRCMQKQFGSLEKAIAVDTTEQKVKISGMEKGILIVIMAFVSTFTSWIFSKFS